MSVVLILFPVYAQTLSHEINFNAINVLNKSGDGWKKLLEDVPININFQFVVRFFGLKILIRAPSHISDGKFFLVFLQACDANNVWNKVIDQLCITFTLRF